MCLELLHFHIKQRRLLHYLEPLNINVYAVKPPHTDGSVHHADLKMKKNDCSRHKSLLN